MALYQVEMQIIGTAVMWIEAENKSEAEDRAKEEVESDNIEEWHVNRIISTTNNE